MEGAVTPSDTVGSAPPGTLKVWSLHLLSLTLPLYVLAFVAAGPHPGFTSLAWLLAFPVMVWLDGPGGPARHPPREDLPSWPFDGLLVLLPVLQFVNLGLAARLVSQGGLGFADAFTAAILVGASSGASAIVVAHELVHRRSKWLKGLGQIGRAHV